MATDINHEASTGVRTYRGRTISELIPQIRSELGSDAIILREREGSVGGVGGFFAQPFVEVDARRGDSSSIDIYDDLPHADLRLQPAPFKPRDITPAQAPAAADAPAPVTDQDSAPPEPKPRAFETDIFLQRLREASMVLPDHDDDVLAPPPAVAPEPEPLLTERSQQPQAALIEQPPLMPMPEPQPEPEPRINSELKLELEASSTEAAPAPPPRRARASTLPDSVRMPAPRPPQRRKSSPQAAASAPPVPANPYSAVRAADTTSTVTERPPSAGRPPARRTAAAAPPPRATRAPGKARAQTSVLKSAMSLLGGRRARLATAPRLALPSPETSAAQLAAATNLTAHGVSPALSTVLLQSAGAHGRIFNADLRAAAESELSRRIIPAPALPVSGAAIAFIGAGGSGKTSCVAALAGAYRRSSSLPVTVVAIDSPDGGQQLRRLLIDEDVQVQALSGARAKRAVSTGREGAMVIIDTRAAAPTDETAVTRLGVTLSTLDLDAVHVALPATLGPQAARRALAGFAKLRPSAAAITHVDESDQLGVIVELAIAHRVPLSYLHSGTDHRSALAPVDPRRLASELLT